MEREILATYKEGENTIVIFRQSGKYHAEVTRGKRWKGIVCGDWKVRPDKHPDWERIKAISFGYAPEKKMDLSLWKCAQRAEAKKLKPLW